MNVLQEYSTNVPRISNPKSDSESHALVVQLLHAAYAIAVLSDRHAPLNSVRIAVGGFFGFQTHWTIPTSVAMSTASGRLKSAMATNSRTKFIEIVLLMPGKRTFRVAAAPASAR
jgi:hypothetical protein